MCSVPAAFRNCARRICPPVVWPARAGRKTRLKQTMDPPLPPESALLAAKSRGACSRPFRPRVGERQPRASAPRMWPWAGRSGRGPLARVAGERCRGGGRRLTARNLRPYAYLNRRRRASLIRPVKRPVRRLAGSSEGFWDDCPLPWPIVRMAGAAARVSSPGGTGPGSPGPPGRGHRPACWAPELARSRD